MLARSLLLPLQVQVLRLEQRQVQVLLLLLLLLQQQQRQQQQQQRVLPLLPPQQWQQLCPTHQEIQLGCRGNWTLHMSGSGRIALKINRESSTNGRKQLMAYYGICVSGDNSVSSSARTMYIPVQLSEEANLHMVRGSDGC
mmetsp:Transcript_73178/g.190592  ORF Transcript_73178/g.190592 Transcript_73178/m.190592 type:complete len:141 (+) Transcript_73178:636-1058(+)